MLCFSKLFICLALFLISVKCSEKFEFNPIVEMKVMEPQALKMLPIPPFPPTASKKPYTVKYTAGDPSNGDQLMAEGSRNETSKDRRDYAFSIKYPIAQPLNRIETPLQKISYVELIVHQDSEKDAAHFRLGGVNEVFADVLFYASRATKVYMNYKIYGTYGRPTHPYPPQST